MRDLTASYVPASPAAFLEGYPADPDFPQLPVASDPGRMLEILRAHLRPLPGRNTRILECRPFRFRCKQSTSRCVLQYTLRLLEPGTGREWDHWATGLVFAGAGAAQRAWANLRSVPPAAEIPPAWRCFEPVAFVSELDMVVVLFPCDRRLPQLGQVLMDGGRALEPFVLARLGPGEWHATRRTLEPTRYRTELAAVLRCSIEASDRESGRNQTVRCFLKVYRNERGQRAFDLLRSWWSQSREESPYSLVRPVAYFDRLGTLALEQAPGLSLREILLAGQEPLAAVRTAARAVAAFNQDDLGIDRTHTLEDQLEQVRKASSMVQWACPALRTEVAAITDAIGTRIAEAPPGPLHGDLKTDHLFLSDDRVILLDADSIALGDPVRDAAHFCSYVTAQVGVETMTRNEARAVAAAFADEYFQHVPASWRKRFQLHYAGALVEVACGIFRHQQPRWLERAEAAIDEARRVMAGEGTLGPGPQLHVLGLRSQLQVIGPGPQPLALAADPRPETLGEDRPRPRLTPHSAAPLTEQHVALMQVLWASGEATARELTDNLDLALAPATVTALLGQLERQGVVARRLADRQHRYRARVGMAEFQQDFVERFASVGEELFEGDLAALVCRLMRVRDVNAVGLARVIELLKARERELEGVQE